MVLDCQDPIEMDQEPVSWSVVFALWHGAGTAAVPATIDCTPQRKKATRARDVANGELIVSGQALRDNEPVSELHVFWVRIVTNEIVGSFKTQNGELKELTLHMCSKIWAAVQTKDLEPDNERVLETGTRIPIVPPRFYAFKINHAETAKRSRRRGPYRATKANERARSRARAARTRTTTDVERKDYDPPPNDPELDTGFDLEGGGVSIGEARVSLRSRTSPTFFLPDVKETEDEPPETVACLTTHNERSGPSPSQPPPVFKSAVWDIFDAARRQVVAHPTYAALLHSNPFESVRSMDDLPSLTMRHHGMAVPVSKEMLRWFHYFFPLHVQPTLDRA